MDLSMTLGELNLAFHERAQSVATKFPWFLVQNARMQFYECETVEFK